MSAPIAIARVSMNGIEVGSIPAERYYALVAEVRSDRRLYVAQALNLIDCVWKTMTRLAWSMPFIWFVIISAIVLVLPKDAEAIISAIRAASPEDLVRGFGKTISFTFLLAAFGFAVVAALSGHTGVGYIDHFELGISNRLREQLEVPADGKISVVVWTVSPND